MPNFVFENFQMVDFGISLKSLTKGLLPKSSKIDHLKNFGSIFRHEKMKSFQKFFIFSSAYTYIRDWRSRILDFLTYVREMTEKPLTTPPWGGVLKQPPSYENQLPMGRYICVFAQKSGI